MTSNVKDDFHVYGSGNGDNGDSGGGDFSSDRSSIQDAIAEASTPRVRCIRKNNCARKMTCEYAQIRNETAELKDLFSGRSSDYGDCANWKARRELNTDLDVIRRPTGSGSKHNIHAPRDAARKDLLQKIERGEPIPFSSHTPEELANMLAASKRKKGK